MPDIPRLQTLARGQALTLRAVPGTALHVLRGRLWLTRSGDPCDHFLETGATVRLDAARTVVEADGGEAALCLRPPGESAPRADQASASSSTSTQCRTGVSVPL